MSIDLTMEFIKELADKYGGKTTNEFNKAYVVRNNTRPDALNDNGAYFGFIHPEEESSGPFHDFSFTIFPNDQNKPWLICLGIGSNGFKNDYELSTYPGLRRLFSKLINENGFCKSDFSDIETGLPKTITQNEDLAHIKKTIKDYTKVLPVCQIIDDPLSNEGKQVIASFLAGYAKLRDWPTNKDHRKSVSDALGPYMTRELIDDEAEVKALVSERKFVVLQGPPGTGKTRMAKGVAESLAEHVEFTQFHAETTYSDFVYGIRPMLDDDKLTYSGNSGSLIKAIQYALNNQDKKVVLIVDEINRANLANVLGPVFYLFEHKMDESNVNIELCPELEISKLPENFYVIATMNTADRSLAVVDFALRRRFAWYDLKPKKIKEDDFCNKDYECIHEIFDWYANSDELSLQPGQGYFIASSDDEMTNRIKYELLPLIKEYLQEGLLTSAKEEFNTYFTNRINQSLFE